MDKLDYEYIASLVKHTKEGDSRAFAELYTATYKKQFLFALHYLKDEFLAQDAIQEVYILVLKNMDKLRDPTLFVSWLNQITFRVCFSFSLKNSQYASELDTAFYDKVLSLHSNLVSPEDYITQLGDQEELIHALMLLPKNQSQALILKYYCNMKQNDIAATMNCSISSVKRYLSSGRKKLKQLLSNTDR